MIMNSRASVPIINPFNLNDKSITRDNAEIDSTFEEMILDRASKVVKKTNKPRMKAFVDENTTESNKVSLI